MPAAQSGQEAETAPNANAAAPATTSTSAPSGARRFRGSVTARAGGSASRAPRRRRASRTRKSAPRPARGGASCARLWRHDRIPSPAVARQASVLVVEDDASLRLLCRLNLELEQFRVREAATLAEARAAVAEERPGMVFLDVHLQ